MRRERFTPFGSLGKMMPGRGGVIASAIVNPLAISGCTLWLRGDLGVTIATGVSQWLDQSSTASVWTQATGSAQPAQNASGIGGQRTLTFTAASVQELDSAGSTVATFLGASSTQWTRFVVAKYTGAVTTTANSWTNAQIIEDGAANWGELASTTVALAYSFSAADRSARPAMTGGSPYYSISQLSGGTLLCSVNGGAASSVVSVTTPGGGGGMKIGGGSTGSAFWNGEIGEIILYNRALSGSEQTQVQNYIKAYWSL